MSSSGISLLSPTYLLDHVFKGPKEVLQSECDFVSSQILGIFVLKSLAGKEAVCIPFVSEGSRLFQQLLFDCSR